MDETKIIARLRKWPAIAFGLLTLALAALWLDSHFHERHFIFLPGGDVGLGFATDRGKLHWVECAPWSNDVRTVYWSKAKVSLMWMIPLPAVPFLWYLVRKHKMRLNNHDGTNARCIP